MHLQHHVCGALRELNVRVLHLPEHHGLGEGQQEGHNPGRKHHQSEENKERVYICLIMMNHLALRLTRWVLIVPSGLLSTMDLNNEKNEC